MAILNRKDGRWCSDESTDEELEAKFRAALVKQAAEMTEAEDAVYRQMADLDNPDPFPRWFLRARPSCVKWLVEGDPTYRPTMFENRTLLPAYLERVRKLKERALRPAVQPAKQEAEETRVAVGDDRDWMLVSEAVAELPFVANLQALYRYAQEHPNQLRLRKHPHHPQRRQAHRADVQRLAQEYNEKELARLDGPDADNLPAISEAGMEALAARMTAARAKKTGK